jgi:hypothetical protein
MGFRCLSRYYQYAQEIKLYNENYEDFHYIIYKQYNNFNYNYYIVIKIVCHILIIKCIEQ